MKVWNYVYISIGLIIILQFLGFDTGASAIFDLLGMTFGSDNSVQAVELSASSFFETLFGSTNGILTVLGLGVGAIIAGLFTRSKPENYVLLPLITGTLVLFISTFVSIMRYAIDTGQQWFSAAIVIILVPFTAGYILALAEFFRGTD